MKATILIIDDDIVDTKVMLKALKKSKISNEIICAENGEEGLEILRKHQDEKTFVVLLDLNMPRMDGHEFLETIRADHNLKSTIVFVVTTSNDDIDKWKAYQKNISGYILKENVAEDFIKKIIMLDYFLLAVELPPKIKPKINDGH